MKTTSNIGPNNPSLQMHTGDIKCQWCSGGNENNVGQRYQTIVDPWTTQVWTAWVHVYAHLKKINPYNTLNVFSLPHSFLNNTSFSLAYYIVEYNI